MNLHDIDWTMVHKSRVSLQKYSKPNTAWDGAPLYEAKDHLFTDSQALFLIDLLEQMQAFAATKIGPEKVYPHYVPPPEPPEQDEGVYIPNVEELARNMPNIKYIDNGKPEF